MIRKHGSIYWLDIWVGKKRIRRSLKTDEYGIAIERARDITLELKRGRPAGITLAEFVPKYLAWAKDTKAAYRSERYQVPIIQVWFESHGAPRLADITPYLIEQFRMEICSRHRLSIRTPRESSRANANRYCALLRVMFNRAKDWDLFEGPNPVKRVKFYASPAEIHVLTDEEKDRVVGAARALAAEADFRSPVQKVIGDLVPFLFNTGLRRAEALELKWRDLKDSTIDVVGKGRKFRKVPLNATAREILARQPRISAYVFDIPNRQQPGLFRHTVLRIRKLSKVPTFHLHLCRHWFTVALLRAGVDIKTVSDILGHSHIMTSLIYAHSTPGGRQQAVEAIDTKHGHGTLSSPPPSSPHDDDIK